MLDISRSSEYGRLSSSLENVSITDAVSLLVDAANKLMDVEYIGDRGLYVSDLMLTVGIAEDRKCIKMKPGKGCSPDIRCDEYDDLDSIDDVYSPRSR